MTIPLSTTLVTIRRVYPDPSVDGQADGYAPNPPAPLVVEADVRAVITPPGGSARLVGGDRVVYNATLQADPCDLQPGDTVTDDSGQVWAVLHASHIESFGNDHMQAGIRRVEGAAP